MGAVSHMMMMQPAGQGDEGHSLWLSENMTFLNSEWMSLRLSACWLHHNSFLSSYAWMYWLYRLKKRGTLILKSCSIENDKQKVHLRWVHWRLFSVLVTQRQIFISNALSKQKMLSCTLDYWNRIFQHSAVSQWVRIMLAHWTQSVFQNTSLFFKEMHVTSSKYDAIDYTHNDNQRLFLYVHLLAGEAASALQNMAYGCQTTHSQNTQDRITVAIETKHLHENGILFSPLSTVDA